ncbi:MAG: XdhC family protein, partial [Thermomicrobia bacterium]|nr:XdhC family protein [Thermomicrobia bacterium]
MDLTLLRALESSVAARRPVATVTVLDGSSVGAELLIGEDGAILSGTSGDDALDQQLTAMAAASLRARRTE